MQCDLCGKKVDFDNSSTYERVAGSKLCRSCLMMSVVDNPKQCFACKKEVISFYQVEGNILCESCFDDRGAAESNEVLKQPENKCEGESRVSKAGIIFKYKHNAIPAISKHPPAEPGAFKIVNRSKRYVQKII